MKYKKKLCFQLKVFWCKRLEPCFRFTLPPALESYNFRKIQDLASALNLNRIADFVAAETE